MKVKKSKLSHFIRKTSMIMIGVLICYVGLAFLLVYFSAENEFIFSPSEKVTRELPTNGKKINEKFANEYVMHLPVTKGNILFSRFIKNDSENIIVYLHGIAATSETLQKSARLLSKATGASIVTPDLLGHGLSQGRPFDLDYIGQYEDDLAKIMSMLKEKFPSKNIYIAGHSMGGGIAMRYALKENQISPAGYILLAPNMGEGPTERKSEINELDDAARSLVVFDIKRFIGLIMFNTIGSHGFDHNVVLTFNFTNPPMNYSYRSIMSAQPIRPNTADKALQAIQQPLLVIVGVNDEVFNASNYPKLVGENSRGQTFLIPGVDHNGVYDSPQTIEIIRAWMEVNG